MPENYLEKALALAAGSTFSERPDATAWAAVEADLRLRFPRPYKDFVSHFGSGTFGTDLYLLNPASSLPQLRLSIDNLREMRDQHELGLARLESNGGPDRKQLIAVAVTTSKIDLCLKCSGNPMSAELLKIHYDLGECEYLGMGIAEFLCKLYVGELPWASDLRQLIWGERVDDPFFRAGA